MTDTSEPMNDATLNHELDKMTFDATGNNAAFIGENEELLNRYMGNLYGDEKPKQSKVISQDVMDVVESDMVSLARVYLGPGDILKFKPINEDDEGDREEAESKTEYVDWQIRQQPWSFAVLSGYIKNALIQKTSVIKYFMEETTEVEEHKKTGLSDEELAVFEASLEGEHVESVEIVREEEGESDENTVVVKVTMTRKQIKLINVPLETFRMTRNASSKDDAELVGDVSLMTRGELLSQGFDKSVISELITAGENVLSNNSRLPDIRDKAEGGPDQKQVVNDNWASQKVEVQDLYSKIDYDGDGISERRHIIRGGETILLNEVFNHVPYSPMSSILMPHKAIGRSRAEITAPTAKIKTALLRGVNNNAYAVNNPRIAANTNVNMDDLLDMRINGIVRTIADSPPGNDLFPIEIPYIGDKVLRVIQYWDQARAQSTGSLLPSQGLNADDLSKETATRFTGIQENSKGKVELVARVMAETGFRHIYEGVAWLDSQFQDAKTEVKVLGEQLKVNPADWKYTHNVVSKVGLGAGDDEKILQTLTALWTLHQQLLASSSPMTDEVKRYNILKGMVKASGLPEVAEYFNDPEKPEALTLAENEIMTKLIEQLQQQIQNVQNPLKEAEEIKAEATLIKAKSAQDIAIEKLKEDQRQFNLEMLQKNDQSQKDIAARLTEIEAKYRVDVPGAVI